MDTNFKGLKPAFIDNYTAIAMSSSDEYLPYLSVCLQSLVDNASDKHNYDIVIFSSTETVSYTHLNYPLYRSSIPHPGRKKFFTNRQKASFNENAANSLSKPFDVGLIGLWYAANYGGFLTYWALYKYLESNSYNTLLIDNCNLVENAYVKSGHRMMLDFIRQYKMNCSDEITNEKELYELNNSLNSFIIGSDQIWCYHLTASCYPNYFLNFANSNKNLIACASSFGHDLSLIHI